MQKKNKKIEKKQPGVLKERLSKDHLVKLLQLLVDSDPARNNEQTL